MRNMKALVVDDSKVGRLTMQKKLEAFGVGVDLAESGLAALDYLERQRPDMIFMDHMMPDLDGFEATRRIKAAPATRDIPVIIISGSDDADFVRDARAIGALDAIAKPPANAAIERILVSLHQATSTPAAVEVTSPAAQPTLQDVAMAQPEQASMQAMIEAGIAKAVAGLRGEWMQALTSRLEAEFEMERERQRGWTSRLEQQLEQSATGLADIARISAEFEALRQRLHEQQARLAVLETAAARDEQLTRELAHRIEAVSGAMQRHVATTQSSLDAPIQRLETMEQRLAALEAGAPNTGLDQATVLKADTRPTVAAVDQDMEARLARRLADEYTSHWQAELQRLQGRVKTLTLVTAAGVVALLTALIILTS